MTYQDGITIAQKINGTEYLMQNQAPLWLTWVASIVIVLMVGATILRLYLQYKEDMETQEEVELILNPVAKEPFKVGDKVFYKVAGIMSGPMHDILEISECGKYALLGFLMKYPFGWVEVSRLI